VSTLFPVFFLFFFLILLSCDSVTRLVVASSAASAAAATLLEACRQLSSTNSPTQQQVEASAKDVIQRLTLFVSTAMNFPTPANAVGSDQMEKHMRVMQLEESLQRERSSVGSFFVPFCIFLG